MRTVTLSTYLIYLFTTLTSWFLVIWHILSSYFECFVKNSWIFKYFKCKRRFQRKILFLIKTKFSFIYSPSPPHLSSLFFLRLHHPAAVISFLTLRYSFPHTISNTSWPLPLKTKQNSLSWTINDSMLWKINSPMLPMSILCVLSSF